MDYRYAKQWKGIGTYALKQWKSLQKNQNYGKWTSKKLKVQFKNFGI